MLPAATRAEVDRRLEQTSDLRARERRPAVRLAVSGQHTYRELARIVACSTTTLQTWFAKLAQGGVAGLLVRRGGPGRPSPLRAPQVQRALHPELRAGRWLSEP